MQIADNTPFGIEIFLSNLIWLFPFGLVNTNASLLPPNFHPCFNCLEMLKRLKAQSGTSATSFITASSICTPWLSQITLGMLPIAMDFLTCLFPMTMLTHSFLLVCSPYQCHGASYPNGQLLQQLVGIGEIWLVVVPATIQPTSSLTHNKNFNMMSIRDSSSCCFLIVVLGVGHLLSTICFFVPEFSAVITIPLESLLLGIIFAVLIVV